MSAPVLESRPSRTLAGATVLQIVPDMRDTPAARAALDLAVSSLRAGSRTLMAGGGGNLVPELQALGGEWIGLEVATGGAWRRRATARKLAEMIRSEQVDLAHAHGPDAARLAVRAVKSAPTVLVTTYAGTPPPPSWRRPHEDAQARGTIVLACSAYAAEQIAQRHRIARDRVVIIPLCVDTGWFDPATVEPERVAAVRSGWRVRPEARVVFAPGRFGISGGQLTLIDAVRYLVNGGLRGVVFVLAADRPDDAAYSAAIDERIEAQGLGGIFRKVGHCADMPAAYAAADIVVLPEERAAVFSMVAAEAQSMARPVVAGNSGAMTELVLAPPADAEGPRTGWLTRPHDAVDLARTLAQALALDHATMSRIGKEARAFASMAFSPEQVAAATLSVYDWLLREAHGSAGAAPRAQFVDIDPRPRPP